MSALPILGIVLPDWVFIAVITAASVVVADVVIIIVDKLVRPLLAKTKTTLDDLLFESLRGPLRLYFVVFGAFWAIGQAVPSFTAGGKPSDELFILALIATTTFAAGRTTDALVKWYSTEITTSGVKRIAVNEDAFPIARKLIKTAVYIAGAVVILGRLGVEIGPIIAGLGIAGLAVALALQDTLKQFFAGIYLLADKPIKTGDLVSLDNDSTSMRGVVQEIGWRSTRIRSPNGYDYLVPNDKVAQSVIVNYDRGIPQKSVVITVGVGYDSDTDKVKRVLDECCRAVMKTHPEIDESFAPIVRFNDFKDSSLEFLVILKARKFTDQYGIVGDLRAEILKAFRRNKIDIPYPIRTVHLKK